MKKLIQQKVQGKDITREKAEKGARRKVIDLMDALKASLEQKGRRRAPVAARRSGARPVRKASSARGRKAS